MKLKSKGLVFPEHQNCRCSSVVVSSQDLNKGPRHNVSVQGRRIARFRKEAGISQQALARMVGVSAYVISRIENNDAARIQAKTWDKLVVAVPWVMQFRIEG